jgi:sulfite reductase alpha subunit-like flavoprotein
VYVQELLKEDREFITKHLFENKGVIFMCGSRNMGNAVDTELFEAVKKFQKIPFKAFKLVTEMQKNKTIVKELFD